MTRPDCRRRGQALVEFTLVAMLLLVLLLGIVQFGIVYNNQVAVTQAAREGARRAIINTKSGTTVMTTQAVAAARNTASYLDQGQMTVAVRSGNGTWTQGDSITVRVEYPYSISVLGVAVKSGRLYAETTMRAE